MDILKPSSQITIVDLDLKRYKVVESLPNRAQIQDPNPEHVEVLKKSLQIGNMNYWNKWRKENKSVQPKLCKINLLSTKEESGRVKRLDLSFADFTDTDFTGATFQYSLLNCANFNNSTLWLSNFMQTSIEQAYFEKVNLTQSSFAGAIINKTNFSKSNLTWSSFFSTHLVACDFSFCDLERVDMNTAMIVGCNFEYGKLLNSMINETNILGHNCPNVENQKCCKVLKSKGIQLKIGVIDLNFK